MNHPPRAFKPQRIYVKVDAGFDATGYMQPKSIIWSDGRIFPIDRIKDFRPAASTEYMSGDCYTVVIQGQEKHLFFERTSPYFHSRYGRWFVQNIDTGDPYEHA